MVFKTCYTWKKKRQKDAKIAITISKKSSLNILYRKKSQLLAVICTMILHWCPMFVIHVFVAFTKTNTVVKRRKEKTFTSSTKCAPPPKANTHISSSTKWLQNATYIWSFGCQMKNAEQQLCRESKYIYSPSYTSLIWRQFKTDFLLLKMQAKIEETTQQSGKCKCICETYKNFKWFANLFGL